MASVGLSNPADSALTGTRVRLFPQPPHLGPARGPETVRLSPPAGSVGPGPSDDRMLVIDPVGKHRPYGLRLGPRGTPYLDLPPWTGLVHPPALPNAAGHLDHLEPGTAAFEMAHIYGTVRRVLDVWEGYFGHPIPWHFEPDYERLEIALLPSFDNAHVGYGFMEVGADVDAETGEVRPFSLNFDVLAHEVGHLIVYTVMGIPTLATEQGEYFGCHESAADLVALLSVLHFDSVLDGLLTATSGNLYTFNELNRFGELSEDEQIRTASNSSKLSDFSRGWSDEHDLSEPLTGAIFDILVDVFHEQLLERGLISPRVEDLFDRIERLPEYAPVIQALFDESYPRNAGGFKRALRAARDYLGVLLAETWRRLSPHYLNYDDVAAAMLEMDLDLSGGRYRRVIVNNVLWRDIGSAVVGPRLAPPGGAARHAFSSRTVTPAVLRRVPKRSYHERWKAAGWDVPPPR
jgi:hypothetical protein